MRGVIETNGALSDLPWLGQWTPTLIDDRVRCTA